RARSADQPMRFTLPGVALFERWRDRGKTSEPARAGYPRPGFLWFTHAALPRPGLLDLYIARRYLRIFCLGVVALLGLFYISKFIDVADKLFRGTATLMMIMRYFYFETPQYIYWIIPMAGLIATLVTVGIMTKNSELVVIKACGVSLYRAAAPIVI